MSVARAFVELTRIDSALLGFLSVFVPYLSRTSDPAFSASQALPILFICMSTFVANDLDDVDKDAINHPSRPLPSRQLPPWAATLVYFVCIAAALYATKYLVDETLAFWYFGLAIVSVSYGYVVDAAPTLKTAYVAVCASAPVAIVALVFPSDLALRIVAVATFLATVGRETCMDIRDRPGDRASWMQTLDAGRVAFWGFVLQGMAIAVIALAAQTRIQWLAVILMFLTLAAACRLWFGSNRRRPSIALMKLEFALGLALLI